MERPTPATATNPCPYCESTLRRVPERWLGRDGFECPRCGDFIDFSRPLTSRDGEGRADEGGELTESR